MMLSLLLRIHFHGGIFAGELRCFIASEVTDLLLLFYVDHVSTIITTQIPIAAKGLVLQTLVIDIIIIWFALSISTTTITTASDSTTATTSIIIPP